MFQNLTLHDALLLMATPKERAEIQLLPRPAAMDVAAILNWSRSRRHELKMKFFARAKEQLTAGSWKAVGFPSGDPEHPKRIHPLMWHSLELRGLDNDVASRSLELKDVVVDVPSALVTNSGASASADAGELDLYGALLRIADDENALAYGAMLDGKTGTQGRIIVVRPGCLMRNTGRSC
jgi:hypothetical protein